MGPIIGIQEYPQSLFRFRGIGNIVCIILGPKSLAGLIAYPVVPPSERPIAKTRKATGSASIDPIPTSGAAINRTAKTRTKAAQRKLVYNTVLSDEGEIPAWIDEALKKALIPDPYKRYAELSEFVFDLRHPNKAFLSKTRPPLMERNPVVFWKSVSFILVIVVVILLSRVIQ